MKIKPSRLREIIQEEVSQFNSRMSAPPDDITGEPDDEGAMARSQLLKLAKYSAALMDMMNDNTQLPAWVQAKITKSASYLGAVKHFIEGELELNEAVSDDPQFKKIPVERHRIQKVVNAFRSLPSDVEDMTEDDYFDLLSELREGIQELEQILMDDQEAELGLNEEKKMKISKQKLERIIRKEVLKEMRMQMREEDEDFEEDDGDYSDPKLSKEYTEKAYEALQMDPLSKELGELKAEVEEVSGGERIDGPEVLLRALKRALDAEDEDGEDTSAVIKSHPIHTDGKPALFLFYDEGQY